MRETGVNRRERLSEGGEAGRMRNKRKRIKKRRREDECITTPCVCVCVFYAAFISVFSLSNNLQNSERMNGFYDEQMPTLRLYFCTSFILSLSDGFLHPENKHRPIKLYS